MSKTTSSPRRPSRQALPLVVLVLIACAVSLPRVGAPWAQVALAVTVGLLAVGAGVLLAASREERG